MSGVQAAVQKLNLTALSGKARINVAMLYLIDDTVSELTFPVAWIKSNGIDDLEYESAVQFWTT